VHEAEQLQWIVAVVNVTAVCVGLAIFKLIVDSARQKPRALRKFGEALFGIVIANLIMIFVVIGALMPAVWNHQDATSGGADQSYTGSDVNPPQASPDGGIHGLRYSPDKK
jgi:uncharacterized membrane protein